MPLLEMKCQGVGIGLGRSDKVAEPVSESLQPQVTGGRLRLELTEPHGLSLVQITRRGDPRVAPTSSANSTVMMVVVMMMAARWRTAVMMMVMILRYFQFACRRLRQPRVIRL